MGICNENELLDATEIADDEIKAEFQAKRRLEKKYKRDVEIVVVKELHKGLERSNNNA